MKISYELRHKEYPSTDPGTFKNSTLFFKGSGHKHDIAKIVAAINNAIAENRSAAEKFVAHIQNHLSPGQDVICKICGKTVNEIANQVDPADLGIRGG